jgi:hypothetical protein
MRTEKYELGDFVKRGERWRVLPSNVSEDWNTLQSVATAEGFVYDPLPALERLKTRKLNEVALQRWEVETGGVVLGNLFIKTDHQTRNELAGNRLRALEDPNYVIENWKLGDGAFVTLTAKQIIAIDSAVNAHVQNCFNIERQLADRILLSTSVRALESICWPGKTPTPIPTSSPRVPPPLPIPPVPALPSSYGYDAYGTEGLSGETVSKLNILAKKKQ